MVLTPVLRFFIAPRKNYRKYIGLINYAKRVLLLPILDEDSGLHPRKIPDSISVIGRVVQSTFSIRKWATDRAMPLN